MDQPTPRPVDTAPRDGTTVRLLVDYREEANADDVSKTEGEGYVWSPGPLEDADVAWTIGHNNLDNDGEDVWQFAGWNWSQDHYTQGRGKVIGWLPQHGDAGDVEPVSGHGPAPLRDEVTYWRGDATARLRTALTLAQAAEKRGELDEAARIRVSVIFPTRAALNSALSGDIYYPLCEGCQKLLRNGDAVFQCEDGGEVHVDCDDPHKADLPKDAHCFQDDGAKYSEAAIRALLAKVDADLKRDGEE